MHVVLPFPWHRQPGGGTNHVIHVSSPNDTIRLRTQEAPTWPNIYARRTNDLCLLYD